MTLLNLQRTTEHCGLLHVQAPVGIEQYPPGGAYPNRTSVFTPVTNDTLPEMHQINATLGLYFIILCPTLVKFHRSKCRCCPDTLRTATETCRADAFMFCDNPGVFLFNLTEDWTGVCTTIL